MQRVLKKVKIIYEMKVATEDFAPGKKISIFIEDQQREESMSMRFVSISKKGPERPLSNPATVYWDHPPRAQQS